MKIPKSKIIEIIKKSYMSGVSSPFFLLKSEIGKIILESKFSDFCEKGDLNLIDFQIYGKSIFDKYMKKLGTR